MREKDRTTAKRQGRVVQNGDDVDEGDVRGGCDFSVQGGRRVYFLVHAYARRVRMEERGEVEVGEG